jgi:uncharacterized protein YcfL
MKRVILVMVAAMTLCGCSGFRSLNSSEMQIQKVIDIPNTPQGVLFDRSRMWYATVFKSANAVIQYENKENGTIMGNGFVGDSIMTSHHDLLFSIQTEVKDNKARITVTGQSLLNPKNAKIPVKARMWDNFKEKIKDIVDGYGYYVRSQTMNPKTENW